MEQKKRRMRGIAVVSLDYGQAKATGPMHSIGQRLFIDSKRSSTPLLQFYAGPGLEIQILLINVIYFPPNPNPLFERMTKQQAAS